MYFHGQASSKLTKHQKTKKRRGQSMVEYAMLTVLVIGLATLVYGPLGAFLENRMGKPLKDRFRRTYKYGDPTACGFDDPAPCSGPKNHPRIDAAENFRMFGRGKK